MKKLFYLSAFIFISHSNIFSQTVFPIEIGTKWYYQGHHCFQDFPQRGYYYGIVKEVTDFLSDSSWEITSKYFYKDSTNTVKEYWTPQYLDNIYDESLLKDTCQTSYLLVECRKLLSYQIFNVSGLAQEFIQHNYSHGRAYSTYVITLPQVGIVAKHYQKSIDISVIDSTYLIAMYRNGELFGDTTFNIASRNDTASFPLRIGQIWYYQILSYPEDNNNYTESVSKKIVNIVNKDFKEISTTYHYKNGKISTTEYWAFTNGKFYISDLPNFNNAILCFDLSLKLDIDLLNSNLNWGKYNFQNKDFDDQYLAIDYPDTPFAQKVYTVANTLGLVSIYTRLNSLNTIYEKLVDMVMDSSTQRVPANYLLTQNYPNPFNSTTKIEYSIPTASFVTIKVYDILGREIATLVYEEKPAGNYEVKFNGSDLSSGIYFYNLRTGDYSSVKKMILMK